MRPTRVLRRMALVGVLVLLTTPAARACAVCYGNADAPMTAGMNNAIVFLLGVVGLVQAAFIGLILKFRNRSKRLAERRSAFHLLDGGAR